MFSRRRKVVIPTTSRIIPQRDSSSSSSSIAKTSSSSSSLSSLISNVFLNHELMQPSKSIPPPLLLSSIPKPWLLFSPLFADRLFASSSYSSSSSSSTFDRKKAFTKQLFLEKFADASTFNELFGVEKRLQEEVEQQRRARELVMNIDQEDGREDKSQFTKFLAELVPTSSRTKSMTNEADENFTQQHQHQHQDQQRSKHNEEERERRKLSSISTSTEFFRIAPPKYWKDRMIRDQRVNLHNNNNSNNNNNNNNRNQNNEENNNNNNKFAMERFQKMFLDILGNPCWERQQQQQRTATTDNNNSDEFEEAHFAVVECLAATAANKLWGIRRSTTTQQQTKNNKNVINSDVKIGACPISSNFVRKASHLYEKVGRPDLFISLVEITAILCYRDIHQNLLSLLRVNQSRNRKLLLQHSSSSSSSSSFEARNPSSSSSSMPLIILQSRDDIKSISNISSKMMNLHPDLCPFFITLPVKRNTDSVIFASTHEKFAWSKRGVVLALTLMSQRRLIEEKSSIQNNFSNNNNNNNKNTSIVTKHWDHCLKCLCHAAVFTGKDDDDETKHWLRQAKSQLQKMKRFEEEEDDDDFDFDNEAGVYYPTFDEIHHNSYACFSVRFVDILDTVLTVYKSVHPIIASSSSSTSNNNNNASNNKNNSPSSSSYYSLATSVAKSSLDSIFKHFPDSLETRLKVISYHSVAVEKSLPLIANILALKQEFSNNNENKNNRKPEHDITTSTTTAEKLYLKSGVEILLQSSSSQNSEDQYFIQLLMKRTLTEAIVSPQPLLSTVNVISTFASIFARRALLSLEDNHNHNKNNKINHHHLPLHHHDYQQQERQQDSFVQMKSIFISMIIGNPTVYSMIQKLHKNRLKRKHVDPSENLNHHHTLTTMLHEHFNMINNNNNANNNINSTRDQNQEEEQRANAMLLLKVYDVLFSSSSFARKLQWTCSGCQAPVFWPAKFCLNCSLVKNDENKNNSKNSKKSISTSSFFTCPCCSFVITSSSPSSPVLLPQLLSSASRRCPNCLSLHPSHQAFLDSQQEASSSIFSNNNNNYDDADDELSAILGKVWECSACNNNNNENQIHRSSNHHHLHQLAFKGEECLSCGGSDPDELVPCKKCGTLNRSGGDVVCKNGCGAIRQEVLQEQRDSASAYHVQYQELFSSSSSLSSSSSQVPLLLWSCPGCAKVKVISSNISQKETCCDFCGTKQEGLFAATHDDKERRSNSDSSTSTSIGDDNGHHTTAGTTTRLILPYQQWRCGCGQLNAPTHHHCIRCTSESSSSSSLVRHVSSKREENLIGKRCYTCSSCKSLNPSSSDNDNENNNNNNSNDDTVAFGSSLSISTLPATIGENRARDKRLHECKECNSTHPLDALLLKQKVWTLCSDCDQILPNLMIKTDANSSSSLRCQSCQMKRDYISAKKKLNDETANNENNNNNNNNEENTNSNNTTKDHDHANDINNERLLVRVSFPASPWSCHSCGTVNEVFPVVASQQQQQQQKWKKRDAKTNTTTSNLDDNSNINNHSSLSIGPSGALLCKGCGADRLPVAMFSETEDWSCRTCSSSSSSSSSGVVMKMTSGYACDSCCSLHPQVSPTSVFTWICDNEKCRSGSSSSSSSSSSSGAATLNPSWLKQCRSCGKEKRKHTIITTKTTSNNNKAPPPGVKRGPPSTQQHKQVQSPSPPSSNQLVQLRYLPWHMMMINYSLSSSSSSAATNSSNNKMVNNMKPTPPPLCELCFEHHASLKCSPENENKRLDKLEEKLINLGINNRNGTTTINNNKKRSSNISEKSDDHQNIHREANGSSQTNGHHYHHHVHERKNGSSASKATNGSNSSISSSSSSLLLSSADEFESGKSIEAIQLEKQLKQEEEDEKMHSMLLETSFAGGAGVF